MSIICARNIPPSLPTPIIRVTHVEIIGQTGLLFDGRHQQPTIPPIPKRLRVIKRIRIVVHPHKRLKIPTERIPHLLLLLGSIPTERIPHKRIPNHAHRLIQDGEPLRGLVGLQGVQLLHPRGVEGGIGGVGNPSHVVRHQEGLLLLP